MNNNLLTIVTQEFYGNRTVTSVFEDELDWFLIGWVDADLGKTLKKEWEKIARKEIDIPNTDFVLIYNPKEEEKKNKDGDSNVLGSIPELNLEIHSRCLICRRDKDGNLASVTPDDYENVIKYLAE